MKTHGNHIGFPYHAACSLMPRAIPLLPSAKLEILEAVSKAVRVDCLFAESHCNKSDQNSRRNEKWGLDWMDEGEDWALVDSACSDWLSHSVVRLPLNGAAHGLVELHTKNSNLAVNVKYDPLNKSEMYVWYQLLGLFLQIRWATVDQDS